MRASKENAAKAKSYLQVLEQYAITHGTSPKEVEATRFVTDFIHAAQKKLPSEAAFIKDEQKRVS